MTADLTLMKNALTPIAKSVLVPFGLTGAASATDAAIQKKILGSCMTTLVFSNENLSVTKYFVEFMVAATLGKSLWSPVPKWSNGH